MATSNTDQPEPGAANQRRVMARRKFLSRLSLGAAGLAGAIVGVPIIGFILGPLIQQPSRVWRAVGAVDSFTIGQTVLVTFQNALPLPWSGLTATSAGWLRRTGQADFTTFSVNCAHLGCPVTWLPDAELFMCPCHGGVYYADGTVAAGPPPRPLYQYPTRVNNGQVEVLTSPLPLAAQAG